MTLFQVLDWAGNDVTNGETFESFDDGDTWIETFIDEDEREDMFVVPMDGDVC